MANAGARYVVVTPVRDEEQYLPLTIECMTKQTVLPLQWVIVDDGSKDGTAQIIDNAAKEHSWIRAVHRLDRGYRKWGAGIIEAFYDGYHALDFADWEFMSKLDGDLSFAPDYFERCFAKFDENPKLGIGGGVLYHLTNGRMVLENHPKFHVRGGTKIYRRACWDTIDGLWIGPGSDTVDEVKANMLGWTTRSFFDIHMVHHRFTGASWGKWGGLVKDGKIDYVSGYHPLFLAAKSMVRLRRRPYIVGSIALIYGYLSAFFNRIPQVDDPSVIRYLRQQQLARLFGGQTIWK
ncbi:MAG TPA: glycosyltransferase family 2 protein [Terracidiphilus sp.]|nr:glycosyltransferase family 2 protein [Terracidiphilus sp.]